MLALGRNHPHAMSINIPQSKLSTEEKILAALRDADIANLCNETDLKAMAAAAAAALATDIIRYPTRACPGCGHLAHYFAQKRRRAIVLVVGGCDIPCTAPCVANAARAAYETIRSGQISTPRAKASRCSRYQRMNYQTLSC